MDFKELLDPNKMSDEALQVFFYCWRFYFNNSVNIFRVGLESFIVYDVKKILP